MKPDKLYCLSATNKETGARLRIFCLSCLWEGKEWLGGELCQHFKNIQTVMEKPIGQFFETKSQE